MSEQNRDDEYSDPTSPSHDPQWDQSSPPPPSEWQSPGASDGQQTDPSDSGTYGTPPPPPPPPGSPYPPQGESPYGASPYGSGAYGSPPPSSSQPGATQPGATPPSPGPYGDPNTPYGAPPPGYYTQGPAQSNTSALVLTILSGIGIFACCGVTVVSLILGIIGLTKQASDPVQSAKLTKWGWIAFGVSLGLAVLGFVLYIVGLASLETGSGF